MMKKGDATQLIEQYKQLLIPYLDTGLELSFGVHKTFGVIITGIELGKTTGMQNAPDKRITEDGKNKTPMIFNVITNDCVLVFIFEDTTVSPLFNGIRFKVGDMNIDFRKV